MSLRQDIHVAFDSISHSTAGMAERVVATVVTEDPVRYRRERLTLRVWPPLSSVAVFLMIATVVAVLAGTRLVNDYRQQASAGQSFASKTAQLEARPLRIPALASPSECTPPPLNAHLHYGSGPVYVGSGAPLSTSWGRYFDGPLYADTDIAGPILVRTRDAINGINAVFVGQFAYGPVVGNDSLGGKVVEQRPKLVLSEGRASRNGNSFYRYEWDVVVGFPNGSSNTIGWQIDGADFSEIVFFC
ncbi:MAG TPA: hypothetical protein VN906_00900 [Candidatus Sulfotelmatobacter sp.]|nr:hypothetical protein [Candidatus Sulfotelmatobacter sp.]